MKQVIFLATFLFSLFLSADVSAQKSKCWSVVGYWESDYVEYNSLDYSATHQFKMRFQEDGYCVVTLVKPGRELTYTLAYKKDPKCRSIQMGDFTMAIEKFEWADELVLRYQSGTVPDGFISPFKAKMRLLEQ